MTLPEKSFEECLNGTLDARSNGRFRERIVLIYRPDAKPHPHFPRARTFTRLDLAIVVVFG